MAAELKIVAKGDVGDAVQGLRSISSETEQVESKFKGFGKAIGGAMAAAGAAAGGLLAKGLTDNLDIGAANAKLAGQLGLTQDEADKAGKVAGAVYAANWGGSIEEINETIRSVSTNLGSVADTSEADLTKMTTAAQTLSDVFGVDVAESTKAAGQLIKNGLAKDSTEAFDLIAAGFRDGADGSGDFLETLTEYSPQFQKLGIGGSQALALLEDGLKAGAKDTDVIADAFKEFSLRAIDGSKATSDAYKGLGLDAKATAADIAAGGQTANGATAEVLQRLNEIKDPLKQNQLGVALFGTQWEDTLRQILPSMADWADASDVVAGSIDQIGATAGGSAKGQMESLQRGFEQWTQSMANSSGATGLVVTGLATFGGSALSAGAQVGQLITGMASLSGGAKIVSAATKTWTAIQAGLNLVMSLNPIALVVIAIAALVAALVIAYNKSATFRNIVNSVWSTVKSVFGAIPGFVGGALSSVWNWFSKIQGKITGFFSGAGSWLRDAAGRVIQGFIDGINAKFQSVKNTLGRLTSLLPSWKGPKSVDIKILRQPGAWVMQGFQESLEAGYSKVERSLSGFTSDLPGAVTADFDTAQVIPAVAATATSNATPTQVTVNFTGSWDMTSDADRQRVARLVRDEIAKLEGATR